MKIEKPQLYKVVKVYHSSKKTDTLARNLTYEQAQKYVMACPSPLNSKVMMMKQY
jgi:hypothetical protein